MRTALAFAGIYEATAKQRLVVGGEPAPEEAVGIELTAVDAGPQHIGFRVGIASVGYDGEPGAFPCGAPSPEGETANELCWISFGHFRYDEDTGTGIWNLDVVPDGPYPDCELIVTHDSTHAYRGKVTCLALPFNSEASPDYPDRSFAIDLEATWRFSRRVEAHDAPVCPGDPY